MRPNLVVRKFANAVAEKPFVVGQHRERRKNRLGGLGRHSTNVIIGRSAQDPSTAMLRRLSIALFVIVPSLYLAAARSIDAQSAPPAPQTPPAQAKPQQP